MDYSRLKEEALREACCLGDTKAVRALLRDGVNVNAKHSINGWTPLHWAAKRAHEDIVDILLAHGADVNVHSTKSLTPHAVCTHPGIRRVLVARGGDTVFPESMLVAELPITPHYLMHPMVQNIVTNPVTIVSTELDMNAGSRLQPQIKEIVIRVRVADIGTTDFVEVDLPTSDLTMLALVTSCAQELDIHPSEVLKVRKLPNILVRKDKDVARLQDGQELELVLA